MDTLQQAREEYADAREAVREQYERFKVDLRFSNPSDPDQWDEKAKAARKGRPMLVLDRTNQYIAQIVNDARQNKIGIQVLPADSRADPEVAKRINGMIRHIEYTSRATIAYDCALEMAARVGLGWIRVVPKIVQAETNQQEITIQRVHDPMSICLDPNSTEPDGCDAMYGFAETTMTTAAFKRAYPKAKQQSFDAEGWFGEDSVRVAEWFRVSETTANRISIQGPDGGQIAVSEDEYWQLAANLGFKPNVLGTFEAKTRKVMWRKLSGAEVLEETVFPSRWIPLVPVLGYELWIEGKRYLCGMVRRMMDGQRLHNYEASAQTEAMMVQPKAPFLVSERAIDGHEAAWNSLNSGNPSYLTFNDIDEQQQPVTPPQRLQPPTFPAAFQNPYTRGSWEMEAAVGMSKSNLGQPSNAISGRAKLADQREGDTANFHYIDNLRRSIEHMGRIVVDMIPTIYDEARTAKIMGEDGEQSQIAINPKLETPFQKQGNKIVAINPGVGQYDVRCKAGPSFASQREETAANLTELSRGNPALGAALAPLLVKMSDLPEAEKIAKVAIAMLPPPVQEIYNEDEEDQADIPPGVKAKMQADAQQMQQMGAAMEQAASAIEELQGKVAEKDTQTQADAQQAIAEITAAQDELKLQAERLRAEQKQFEDAKRMTLLEIENRVLKAKAEAPNVNLEDDDGEEKEPPKEDQMLLALAQMVQNSQQSLALVAESVQAVAQQVAALGGMVVGSKPAAMEKLRDQGGQMIGARITQADGSTRDVMIQ